MTNFVLEVHNKDHHKFNNLDILLLIYNYLICIDVSSTRSRSTMMFNLLSNAVVEFDGTVTLMEQRGYQVCLVSHVGLV